MKVQIQLVLFTILIASTSSSTKEENLKAMKEVLDRDTQWLDPAYFYEARVYGGFN
jgi:hypothetical protein